MYQVRVSVEGFFAETSNKVRLGPWIFNTFSHDRHVGTLKRNWTLLKGIVWAGVGRSTLLGSRDFQMQCRIAGITCANLRRQI